MTPKTPDIGADTNPCIVVPLPDDSGRAAAVDGEILEPLGQAIDAAIGMATPTIPVVPPATGMPDVATPGAVPATGQQPTRRPAVVDPFRGNPLQSSAAGHRPCRGVWIASIAVHATLATLLLLLPGRAAHDAEPQPIEIAFYSPDALLPQPQALPEIQPEPLPEPVTPPDPLPRPEPEIARPVEPSQPLPEPNPAVAEVRPPVPQPEPPQPRVQTDVLAQADPAPQPKKQSPPRKARMAGFTRADAGAGEQPKAEPRVAQAGAFGSEPEPVVGTGKPDNRVVAAGSFSDGPVTVPRAGATPRRGTVSKASFDDAPAESDPTAKTKTRERGTGSVTRGGFGDDSTAAATPRKRQRPDRHLDTPVEILAKTKPVYSDEARKLRIEGEVVLEVRFDASGELRVLRVVDGLGHGLDEAAIDAAEKIEFTPARQNGQPVGYTATLRVVFRLA